MNHFSLKLRKILLCNELYYMLLVLTIIYMIIYINNYIPQYKYNINETVFDVTIKYYYIDANKLSIELIGKENLVGTYYFDSLEEAKEFKQNYALGDTIKVVGQLSYPKNNTIPNTFNYRKYLLYKKTYYILKIEEFKKEKKNKKTLLKLKNTIINRIDNIDNNEYLYAFILGNSKYLPNEVSSNYKINTITHLFALSGLHVSIFAGIIMKLLKNINEKVSLIIISIVLLLLCFITSFTPSIVRATLFFILININKIYYTHIKTKYLLYITFIIMILINPFYIYNLGFILSFTITFFLVYSNEYIKINNKILSLLVMSIIAFISSFPIIINNFYEINVLGFINNLFFVPYVSSIVYPFSLLTFIFPILLPILNVLTNIMEYISDISANILNYNIYFSKLSYIVIIIYYSLLLLSVKYKNKILYLLLSFLIIIHLIKDRNKTDTHIYVIDVGQGDSILITNRVTNILIDTGGKEYYYEHIPRNKEFNLMKNSMIPFFKSIGIKKIDYLLITHGDADHCGYANALIDNFKIKNVILNIGSLNELESNIVSNLNNKNINYFQEIDNINIDEFSFSILNTKDYNNENENSNVIYLNYNNIKLLFMGDAGVSKEKDIIKKYNLNNIDILKVGHHGSDTSSSKEFINSINPKTCLISVGSNNKFGHPTKDVLNTLEKCSNYRTDIDGSIEIVLKENNYTIYNYN